MTNAKKLIKTSSIYLLGNVLSKILIFFLLPLYTKYIPVDDMGYFDASTAAITFFATVLFLEIGIGIMRFMMEKKETLEKKLVIYSGLVIFLISSLLYFFFSFILGLFTNFQYFIWIIICAIVNFAVIFAPLYSMLFAFLSLYGGEKVLKTDNLLEKVIWLYFSLVMSLGIVMFNITITLITLSYILIPMLIIKKALKKVY